jgi:geranylgeranyl transferase type-2 subunit beta
LSDLKGLGLINLEKVKSYLNSTELPDGGFRGGSWDAGADVEYTFYGLGALALVHGMGANS